MTELAAATFAVLNAIRAGKLDALDGLDPAWIYNSEVRQIVLCARSLDPGTVNGDAVFAIADHMSGGLKRFNDILADSERKSEGVFIPLVRGIDVLKREFARRRRGALLGQLAAAHRADDQETLLSSQRDLGELLEQQAKPNSQQLFTALGDFPDIFEDIPYLIGGLIPRQALVFFPGLPKTRKSTTAALSLVCVAGGVDFLGHPVDEPGTVLYVSAEESTQVVVGRFRKLVRGLDLTPDIEKRISENLRVCCGEPWLLDLPSFQIKFEAELRRHRPAYVVLDPMVAIRGSDVDENSVRGMEPLLSFLRNVRLKHEVAVGVVHHSSKGVELAPSPETFLRGSGASAASFDVLVGSTRLGDDGLQNLLHIFSRHAAPRRLVASWSYSDITGSIQCVAETPVKTPTKGEAVDLVFEVEKLLANAPVGLTVSSIRISVNRSNKVVKDILASLERNGRAITKKGRTIRKDGQPYTTDLWFARTTGEQSDLQYN